MQVTTTRQVLKTIVLSILIQGTILAVQAQPKDNGGNGAVISRWHTRFLLKPSQVRFCLPERETDWGNPTIDLNADLGKAHLASL